MASDYLLLFDEMVRRGSVRCGDLRCLLACWLARVSLVCSFWEFEVETWVWSVGCEDIFVLCCIDGCG